jgi:hypothetical protein
MPLPELNLEETKARVDERKFPRVTEELIKAKIAKTDFLYYQHLTICVLTMANGYFVTGKAAAADPHNHDPAIGRRYAYQDAFRHIWQLEGYLLREKLAG